MSRTVIEGVEVLATIAQPLEAQEARVGCVWSEERPGYDVKDL